MPRRKIIDDTRDKTEKEIAASLLYYDAVEFEKFLEFYSKINEEYIPLGNFPKFIDILVSGKELLKIEDYDEKKQKLLNFIYTKINLDPNKRSRTITTAWFEDVISIDNPAIFNLSEEIFYKYQWLLKKEKINNIDTSNLTFKEKCSINLESDLKIATTEDFRPISETINDYSSENGEIEYKYYKTNTPFDNEVKPMQGDFFIIAARPSVGKTAFALQMGLFNAASGIPTAYFSLEMNNLKINKRVMNWYKGRDVALRDHRAIAQEEEFKIINDNFFVYDKYLGAESLFLKMEAIVKKKHVEIVIVDYLQLVKYAGKDEWSSLRKLTYELKKFAKEHNVLVVSLNQALRSSETMGLDLTTLFGGVSLEADTDIIIGLEANDRESLIGQNNIRILKGTILKNRDGERGTMYKLLTDYITLKMEETN